MLFHPHAVFRCCSEPSVGFTPRRGSSELDLGMTVLSARRKGRSPFQVTLSTTGWVERESRTSGLGKSRECTSGNSSEWRRKGQFQTAFKRT